MRSIQGAKIALIESLALQRKYLLMIFDSKIRARFHLSKEYKIIHLVYLYVDKLTIMSL